VIYAVRFIVRFAILNLVILALLWALQSLSMLLLILSYEAVLVLAFGAFQFLGSCIYREDSVTYGHAGRTAWWDFKRFAKLTPEERERGRQEAITLMVIGATMMLLILIARLLTLA
jgi:hypothetical protein